MRVPNGVLAAKCSDRWIGLRSPVSCAKPTTSEDDTVFSSVSVMPTARSSKNSVRSGGRFVATSVAAAPRRAGDGIGAADRPRGRRRSGIYADHMFGDPVGDEIDAELAIVHLAMLGRAVFGRKNFQRLIGGPKRDIQALGFGCRHNAVVGAVQHQERAAHPFGDARERELLDALDGTGKIESRNAEHPRDLKMRRRHRAFLHVFLSM